MSDNWKLLSEESSTPVCCPNCQANFNVVQKTIHYKLQDMIIALEQAGDELVKMVERGMGGYLEYHREEAEKALADWQKVRGDE
jgi:hypothetical protein